MAVGSITFNGITSTTYGIIVSGSGVFNAPAKSYEMVAIPGRNGDLILDNDRFDNIEVTYPAIIMPDNYSNNIKDIRKWLSTAEGYCVLRDTYNTDEYRLACFNSAVNIQDMYFTAGATRLTFICRPERFLDVGDIVQNITVSGSTINNTYGYESKPILVITGYGTLTITNADGTSYQVVVADQFTDVTIDSDLMICYHSTTNANMYVQIEEFPKLKPGLNTITFDNTITNVKVTPKWWRL